MSWTQKLHGLLPLSAPSCNPQKLAVHNSPAWSNVASDVKSIPGYTIPWPRLAGKMYTKYFHRDSTKPSDVTNAFPKTMRKAPVRTSGINLPHRDMTTPATKPPIGVASDGIARRAPAVVAESNNTI